MPESAFSGPSGRGVSEGFARVVAVEHGQAVLEPEQTTSCGGCHAAKACGVDAGSRRLVARRFTLANDYGLRVGERVVVGIAEGTVLRAALAAFGIPLAAMLVAGVTAQRLMGDDLFSLGATLVGLGLGLLAVRLWTARKAARGELTPHFIRRAGLVPSGGACHLSDG
jgi:sigma-E factor negative regulatory protein RseC